MKTLKLSAVAFVVAFAAFAQDKATIVSKEGVGEAAVVGKEELKAYDEAQKNALRNAVEQAAGVRIDADTAVVNNQLVRDQVFANTSGYVKSFTVTDKKIEKGVATVKVKADVITDNLDKDINAARDLVKRMGRPSIVIVIQEQTIPLGDKAIINSEHIATALTEAFKADGWFVADPHAMNKALNLEGAATLGPTQMKEDKQLAKVRYVLYGKAALRHEDSSQMPQYKNSPIFFISGEYDLALADTESEEQIAKISNKLTSGKETTTVSYERTTYELVKARQKEITTPVRQAILERFRNETVNGKSLAVTVTGLESFGAASDFEKALVAMKGMKEAVQDNYADGKAVYRVVYLGSSKEFASAAEAATFKKKKLNVVSVGGSSLELKVGK